MKRSGLPSMEAHRQLTTIALEDRLAAFNERDLQVVVLQDLDKSVSKTWYLQAVLNASNEAYRVDVGADRLK
jgi:hypothetical protein